MPNYEHANSQAHPLAVRPTLRGHIQIARTDHWFKNVFVVPGILAAIGLDPSNIPSGLVIRMLAGFLSICLVASSNYVLNEVLDAPSDRWHPSKRFRPVPSGKVSPLLAYIQWIALMLVGVGLAYYVSLPLAITHLILWIMGCIYNLPPIRSKDLPYVDVLSEAINNPIRMVAGWYIAGTLSIPPTTLILSYWMVGCYFMAIKRYAEYVHIGSRTAAAYRKSFFFYTRERLMVSIMFYGAAAMLFLGAFIMRYKLELILSFPLVALVMAVYLSLAFKEDSTAQRPEHLYRERSLMLAVISCALVMAGLLLSDIPLLHRIFVPTVPTAAAKVGPTGH
jgi:decaprenyl-phosphate phosphoribosyltransferase